MKRRVFLMIALLLWLGCACAETDAADKAIGFDQIISQYGVEVPDFSAADALKSPEDALTWLIDTAVEPVRETLSRLRYVLLPVALLMVMQAGMGDGASAPLLACRLAVLTGCIAIAQAAVQSAQECISRAMAFSDSAAPVIAATLTATGMTGRAALLSPAAAMIGDICQKAYSDVGLTLTRAALCLSAAGGICQTMDLSGMVRFLRSMVNWGAGLIGSIFAALISYAGANAFAQDTVALRATKYAFDSASGIIGGTSELWGGSIAGFAALRSAVGFGGSIAVLAVCIQPMLKALIAFTALRFLAALMRLFGDGRIASSVDQLSGACQMALMLSCSAAAIVIVLIGCAASIGGAIV